MCVRQRKKEREGERERGRERGRIRLLWRISVVFFDVSEKRYCRLTCEASPSPFLFLNYIFH